MTETHIPWAKPYLGAEELRLLQETVQSGWLSQGPRVRALEERVTQLTGCEHVVAVNSGTAALDIALKLKDVQPGDEVIVPAFAYIASVNAILYQGATPVFADVENKTLNLDPADACRKITSRTRGIVALDYAGHGADWKELTKIARERQLFALEDAAPAFGGALDGRSLGVFGDVGITSLHTAKVFQAVEGGLVFCHSDEDERRARIMRSQGESPTEKYVHPMLGHNYRLSDLHAAIGLGQLSRYSDVLGRRAQAAAYYAEKLDGVPGIVLPTVREGHTHAWFLYCVRVPQRDAVRAALRDRGIETNVSWPYPAYAQDHLKKYFTSPCPVAESACRSVLCLPTYYELTRADQDVVVDALIEIVGRTR